MGLYRVVCASSECRRSGKQPELSGEELSEYAFRMVSAEIRVTCAKCQSRTSLVSVEMDLSAEEVRKCQDKILDKLPFFTEKQVEELKARLLSVERVIEFMKENPHVFLRSTQLQTLFDAQLPETVAAILLAACVEAPKMKKELSIPAQWRNLECAFVDWEGVGFPTTVQGLVNYLREKYWVPPVDVAIWRTG